MIAARHPKVKPVAAGRSADAIWFLQRGAPDGGYREDTDGDVERLRRIRGHRAAGLTLDADELKQIREWPRK